MPVLIGCGRALCALLHTEQYRLQVEAQRRAGDQAWSALDRPMAARTSGRCADLGRLAGLGGIRGSVDAGRIDHAFPSLDFFEDARIPAGGGGEPLPGSQRFDPEEIREALAVSGRVPLVPCGARDRESVKQVILALPDGAIVAAPAWPAAGLIAFIGPVLVPARRSKCFVHIPEG